MIRLGVEVQVQNLELYSLLCYEFGKPSDKKKTLVFSRVAPTVRMEEALGESIRVAGHLPEKPRLLRHFVIDSE
jgi:hypothetical protein